MHDYTIWHALIGGVFIGLASLFATVLSGKIPGISGVFGRLLVASTTDPPSQRYGATGKKWRFLFLLGLIGGFGTRLGGGCTSGHGVCGVGIGAKDSIAATLIFMGAGMLTVLIYNRLVL